jgi:type VI protein secretion system component Hcp
MSIIIRKSLKSATKSNVAADAGSKSSEKKLSLGSKAKGQKNVELKVAMQDFHFTKKVDKSSPTFFL